VGSHVLIGLALGMGLLLTAALINNGDHSTFGGLYLQNGPRYWIAGLIGRVGDGINTGIVLFFVIFGLRWLLRKDWAAAIAGGIIVTLTQGDLVSASNWVLTFGVLLILLIGLIFALLRFGLLVTVAAVFALNTVNAVSIGTDWNAWWVPTGVATAAVLLALTAVAFRNSYGKGVAVTSS
jgi:hypothetical protein